MFGPPVTTPVAVKPKPTPIAPAFIDNVYACSPYGDVARQNKLWYADGATANGLAAKLAAFGAVPMLSKTSPETGPYPTRWNVAQIPVDSPLIPPMGMRQSDPSKIAALMALPPFMMWVLTFPNGISVNAGYLSDYYRRNPETQFPGLADWYVLAILRVSGAI